MPEVVLIVDDDPVQRRLLESMIQRFGYQVMVAEGGDAAIRALVGPEASRIDGVVLDLVMPDLDGLGVLARMREAGLTIPVIVQTAHGGIDSGFGNARRRDRLRGQAGGRRTPDLCITHSRLRRWPANCSGSNRLMTAR
jgi:DNA-binding NtrC family response regulator